jgi:hypothetical protein
MATSAVRAAAPAVAERLQGGQPSRLRALLAATVLGAAVAVGAYRLLRSASPNEESDDSE